MAGTRTVAGLVQAGPGYRPRLQIHGNTSNAPTEQSNSIFSPLPNLPSRPCRDLRRRKRVQWLGDNSFRADGSDHPAVDKPSQATDTCRRPPPQRCSPRREPVPLGLRRFLERSVFRGPWPSPERRESSGNDGCRARALHLDDPRNVADGPERIAELRQLIEVRRRVLARGGERRRGRRRRFGGLAGRRNGRRRAGRPQSRRGRLGRRRNRLLGEDPVRHPYRHDRGHGPRRGQQTPGGSPVGFILSLRSLKPAPPPPHGPLHRKANGVRLGSRLRCWTLIPVTHTKGLFSSSSRRKATR